LGTTRSKQFFAEGALFEKRKQKFIYSRLYSWIGVIRGNRWDIISSAASMAPYDPKS
jgi:hypothetical protein